MTQSTASQSPLRAAYQRLVERFQGAGQELVNLLARTGNYTLSHDVVLGADPRQQLDYYRTGTPLTLTDDKHHPLMLFFYGGAWRSGARQEFRFVADTLCRLGCDVVIADHRLFPGVRFEQILEDVTLAGRWVSQYTPAAQPVIIMGHSSGAQLGALLSLNQALINATGLGPPRVAGFVGLSGPYDFYPFTESDHWDQFAPRDQYPLSQPVNFVRADGPPLYLLHGAEDVRVRRGHSRSLMEKMQQAGGWAEREVYPALGHTDTIKAFTVLHRRGNPVVRDVARFIRERAAAVDLAECHKPTFTGR